MHALVPILVLWLATAPAGAETFHVEAGGSIAEALEKAPPGSVVEVAPGVYHEALTVDTPGITLRGLVRGGERPILDGQGELNDGVIVSGSPFTMTGFGIRHYKGNGVTTQGVDGVLLSDLVIDDAGLYGVYPVQSRNITVTHCTVTRIRDAGIYVGESNRALVAYNEVHDNVAGIEIENTNDAVVRDNLAYDNTAGILVFVLPGKVQKEGLRTEVLRNWVVRNNAQNFGDPESIVGGLPPGLGILVMGADDTGVHDNWVKDNVSAGIGVVRLAEEQAAKDPELEPLSDRTRIGPNYLSANGLQPAPSVQEAYGGGGDFAWDGTGLDNCVDLTDAHTRVGAFLRACGEVTPAGRREGEATPVSRRAPPGAAQGAYVPPDVSDADAVVRIRGMRYHPKHLTVAQGSRVAWVNDDAVAHTVTSGEGTLPTNVPLASPFMMRGDVFRHAFDAPGRYEYLCLPHLDQAPMREASVTVRD